MTLGTEAAALERARARKRLDRVLVQEFLPEIQDGELAGVFFDHAFSHGLRRRPAPGEFRINAQYGGTLEAAALSSDVVESMADEPGLGLDLAPGSADRFAAALRRRL